MIFTVSDVCKKKLMKLNWLML